MATAPESIARPSNHLNVTSQESAPSNRPNRIRGFLAEPFRASAWKRLAYILLALPVGLLCVPLALVGGPAGRIQAGLAARLLGSEFDLRRRHRLRAFALTVLSGPTNLAAVVVGFYFWTVVVINLGYPLRPGNDYHTAWGGPTLAGAWAFHAVFGGVVFFFLTAWVMRGFTALQARLIKGFLGTGGSGLVRTIILALGTALICALLSVPVVHQL